METEYICYRHIHFNILIFDKINKGEHVPLSPEYKGKIFINCTLAYTADDLPYIVSINTADSKSKIVDMPSPEFNELARGKGVVANFIGGIFWGWDTCGRFAEIPKYIGITPST